MIFAFTVALTSLDWQRNVKIDNHIFTSDEQEALFQACVNLIGRSGAKEMTFGYLNDDAIKVEEGDWWAEAQYQGARLFVEHFIHPVDAVFALAMRVIRGAKCAHCGRVVTLTPGEYFAYMNSTLLNGEKWDIETTYERGSCLWIYNGQKFEVGCKLNNEETTDATSSNSDNS